MFSPKLSSSCPGPCFKKKKRKILLESGWVQMSWTTHCERHPGPSVILRLIQRPGLVFPPWHACWRQGQQQQRGRVWIPAGQRLALSWVWHSVLIVSWLLCRQWRPAVPCIRLPLFWTNSITSSQTELLAALLRAFFLLLLLLWFVGWHSVSGSFKKQFPSGGKLQWCHLVSGDLMRKRDAGTTHSYTQGTYMTVIPVAQTYTDIHTCVETPFTTQ